MVRCFVPQHKASNHDVHSHSIVMARCAAAPRAMALHKVIHRCYTVDVMPTKKKRLNLILPKEVAIYLEKIALRDEMSQSQKAIQMIEEALEIAEDEYFVKIAEERIKKGGKYISHEEFWKKVL